MLDAHKLTGFTTPPVLLWLASGVLCPIRPIQGSLGPVQGTATSACATDGSRVPATEALSAKAVTVVMLLEAVHLLLMLMGHSCLEVTADWPCQGEGNRGKGSP